MGLPQYNASQDLATRTLWYSGTDTLREGYVLAYKNDATLTDADPKLRLGSNVVKPATANLKLFAGIVAESSDGKTGPCFVDVIVPRKHDILVAYTKVNATALSTTPSGSPCSFSRLAWLNRTDFQPDRSTLRSLL